MLRKLAMTNSVAIRGATLRGPALTRMLVVKASDPVVDKEAEQEQMEQVSQQMEDAIVKEKQVHDTRQADKSTKMWDTSSETIRSPEERTQQSKSEELGNIEKEQIKLSEQELASLPGRKIEHQEESKTSLGDVKESMSGKGGVVDKVLDTMTKTKETLKETFPGVHDFGHEVKKTTKATMNNLKDMAESSMPSSSDSGNSDPNIKHDTKVTQAGDPEVPKPRSKQFSESKQNSSLF